MKTYSHGGDISTFKEKTGCKEVLDLSSNINFIKPKIKKDFNNLPISSYPDYDKLYKALSKRYKVKKSQIELFNGATSAIYSFFSRVKSKKVVIYSPAYLEYKRASKLFKKEVILIDRFKNLYEDIPKNSLVIFVNPSTPDGRYYKLKKLFKLWKKRKATVLVDESFLEFCKKCKSAVSFLKSYKKLYILKSLTKFYSSAGVRVGIIISNKKNIKKLKKYEPLWKISEFDKNYILEALKDKSFKKRTFKENKKAKRKLLKSLESLSFVKKIYPSSANFVLVKLKDITAKEFQKRVQKRCIMIRDCSNFDFLDDSFVRIAVKGDSLNMEKIF